MTHLRARGRAAPLVALLVANALGIGCAIVPIHPDRNARAGARAEGVAFSPARVVVAASMSEDWRREVATFTARQLNRAAGDSSGRVVNTTLHFDRPVDGAHATGMILSTSLPDGRVVVTERHISRTRSSGGALAPPNCRPSAPAWGCGWLGGAPLVIVPRLQRTQPGAIGCVALQARDERDAEERYWSGQLVAALESHAADLRAATAAARPHVMPPAASLPSDPAAPLLRSHSVADDPADDVDARRAASRFFLQEAP